MRSDLGAAGTAFGSAALITIAEFSYVRSMMDQYSVFIHSRGDGANRLQPHLIDRHLHLVGSVSVLRDHIYNVMYLLLVGQASTMSSMYIYTWKLTEGGTGNYRQRRKK